MDLQNRLFTLDIETRDLYEIFLHEISKKAGEKGNKEILKSVQQGMKTKFGFEEYLKNRYERKTFVKQKNGREIGGDIIKIKIENQLILEKEFEDELLERARLMRGWIWENMSDESFGNLRGGGGDEVGTS